MPTGGLGVGARCTLALLGLWLSLGVLACGSGREPQHGGQSGNPDIALLEAQAAGDEARIQAIDRVKGADAATLAAATPGLIALLSNDSPSVVRAAEGALTAAGAAAVRPLVLAYNDEPKRPAIRRVLQLAKADPAEIDTLARDMTDQSMVVRLKTVELAECLARRNEGAVRLLVMGLKDKEPAVQLAAVGALADLGPTASSATPEPASLLFSESPNLSEQAARALGMIGPGATAARADLERASRAQKGRVALAAKAAIDRLGTSPQ